MTPEWHTIEEPRDLVGALASVSAEDTVLVDCLSLWVANGGGRGDAALEVATARDALTIAVSNEVGLGIVPANGLAREFRDVLGRVNVAWATAADEAWFVVAGKTLRLS